MQDGCHGTAPRTGPRRSVPRLARPGAAGLQVHVLRAGFGETVGECLRHDRLVVVASTGRSPKWNSVGATLLCRAADALRHCSDPGSSPSNRPYFLGTPL